MIPYGRHSINEDDIDAVVAVLKSERLTQGPVVEQFEVALADYCSSQYAVSVCNATLALHLACLALDIGDKDIVWTSPISFVASANCALYCGASIDFVDIDENTYNISIASLQEKLLQAEKTAKLPKLLIAVHFAGQSCEMQAIHQLSQKYGFRIIEDASHAIGGQYQDHKIGSCQFSDMCVFSFHPVKIITSGEGGMITSNNKKLVDKLRLLRNSGISREQNEMTHESEGGWYYQQIELGYNYRLSDIHAALGLSQLKQLDKFVNKRRAIAETYLHELKNLPVKLPQQHPDTSSSWHLFTIQVHNRLSVYEQLHQAGIAVQVHYIPIHTQPYYQKSGFKPGDFPRAESYYEKTLTLPIFYDLDNDAIQYVVNTLTAIIR